MNDATKLLVTIEAEELDAIVTHKVREYLAKIMDEDRQAILARMELRYDEIVASALHNGESAAIQQIIQRSIESAKTELLKYIDDNMRNYATKIDTEMAIEECRRSRWDAMTKISP